MKSRISSSVAQFSDHRVVRAASTLALAAVAVAKLRGDRGRYGPLVRALLVSTAMFVGVGCSDEMPVEHEDAPVSFGEFLASAPSLRPGDIGVMGSSGAIWDLGHLEAPAVYRDRDEGRDVVYGILPVEDSPGRATAMFLASSASMIKPDEIGIFAKTETFEEIRGVGIVETLPHRSDGWSYGVVPLPTSPLALGFFFAAQDAGAEECVLGRDYFDKPGAWDFIRGSEKADAWEAWGQCLDALMVQTANSDCTVTSQLVWNSEGEYWDAVGRLECPE